MTIYVYRCGVHGRFEVSLPMGTATPSRVCPGCGDAARRVYSAPRLALADPVLMSAIDRAEKSRTEPDVVSVPTGRTRRRPRTAPMNPALARLPRP